MIEESEKKQQSKPPIKIRRVWCSEIAVIQDGETFYPHASEWVDFIGRPMVGISLAISQMGRNERTMQMLKESIKEWNWTDDSGKKYSNPPTLDDFMRLSPEEIGFLIRASQTEIEGEETRKNDSTPFT